MDLTRIEWRGGMSCRRSSGRAGVGDPGSKRGSSSLTCSSSTCSFEGDLGEVSKISGGWIEKSKRGLRVFIEGRYDSSRKISKTDEVVREERKWECSTKEWCFQKTTLRETWRRRETRS